MRRTPRRRPRGRWCHYCEALAERAQQAAEAALGGAAAVATITSINEVLRGQLGPVPRPRRGMVGDPSPLRSSPGADGERWGWRVLGGQVERARSGWPVLRVGQRVRWAGDRVSYTVRAVSSCGRWVILTRPFPLMKTVLYTVVDFARGVRGADNCYGLGGYETAADIADAMAVFVDGAAEVSYRNWVWLRYTDTQPDPVTQAQLEELRSWAARPFPGRQNDREPRRAVVVDRFDVEGARRVSA